MLSYTLSAQIRLATYNIRFDTPKDAPTNSWEQRKNMIPGLINFHDFDVFGLQESTRGQVADLEKELPAYTFSKFDPSTAQDKLQIAFKTGKFKLVKSGNFWLSPDPTKAKKAWDAKFARNCSWVCLQEITSGFTFYYFNTHLDHVGTLARTNSVQLILKKIKEIAADKPVVLSGDFNFGQDDDNYAKVNNSGLLKDAFELAAVRYAPNGTFNGFNITKNSNRRIDHIFVGKGFNVSRYGVLTDNFGGKFPSDHFPVLVELEKIKNAKI